MKRAVIGFLLLAVCWCGCALREEEAVMEEAIPEQSWEIALPPDICFVSYSLLEQVEDDASLVLRGTLEDDAAVQYQQDGHTIYDIVTVSTLEVSDVYKGELSAGDTISLCEPYYMWDGRLYQSNTYLPSTPGREYLFLLVPHADGLYEPVEGDWGRYSLGPGDENPTLSDAYRAIHQEVLEKYGETTGGFGDAGSHL